jgi:hypothetical protein
VKVIQQEETGVEFPVWNGIERRGKLKLPIHMFRELLELAWPLEASNLIVLCVEK